MGASHGTVAERFERHVERIPFLTCWVWIGATNRNGYGQLRVNRRTESAHRIAYQLYRGPIHNDLELDHLCRNRWCVNPAHLEPVTHRENLLRGKSIAAANAIKKTCSIGHPFDIINTRIARGQSGSRRRCRQCHAARNRAWRLRQKRLNA